jgi:DNA-binding NarL/FixJ family response regulator
MIDLGVEGIIDKGDSIHETEDAIRQICTGGNYLGSGIQTIMREIVHHPHRDESQVGLTSREREIIGLIAHGQGTREIAKKLGVSINTVGTHRTRIMRKLHLHNAADIACYAITHGLVEPQ